MTPDERPGLPGAAAGRLQRCLPYAAVALAAFAVYAATLFYELVWDDPALVDYAMDLVRRGGIWELLTAEFILDSAANESLGYYRPVVLLSFWTDATLSRSFPGFFHLTNVILHASNSLLVLFFARLFLFSRRAALIAALIFAVHPVHAESVAFISGRTDLWAALFTIFSSLVWLRSRRSGSPPGAAVLLLSGTAFLLAILSKETAFMLPAALLSLDAIGERGGEQAAGWWRRNAPWMLVWAAALAVATTLRLAVAGIDFGIPGGAAEVVTITPGMLFQKLAAGCLYLRLLIIPWPLNPAYTDAHLLFSAATIAGTALFVALCFATASRSQQRAGLLCLLWTGAFLLPVSGLLSFHGAPVAARFLYLPSLGLAIALGQLAERAFRSPRLRRPAYAGLFALGVVFSAATVSAAKIWRNNFSLYTKIVEKSPLEAVGHNNLGLEYYHMKRYDEALPLFQRALELNPDFAGAYTNLGSTYRALRLNDEALEAYRHAVRLSPDHSGMLHNLGDQERTLGLFREAAETYEKAVSLLPESAELHFKRGQTYSSLGQSRQAAEAYREAIRIMPDIPDGHFNLGVLLVSTGDLEGARRELAVLRELGSPSADRLRDLLAGERPAKPQSSYPRLQGTGKGEP